MEKYPKKRAYVRGKLKEFLIEKGAYEEFVEECKQQEINSPNSEVWRTRDCKVIPNSFSFNKSIYGQEYWYKMSAEFDAWKD